MRIVDYELAQSSNHQLLSSGERRESLQAWVGAPPAELIPTPAGNGPPMAGPGPTAAALVNISAQGRELAQGTGKASSQDDAMGQEAPEVRQIRLVLEALTGKRIKMARVAPLRREESAALTVPATESGGEQQQLAGWGLAYDLYLREEEREQLAYRAAGRVRTADGRSIDFNLQLNLSRETVRELNISIRAGDAQLIDPLVINLAAAGAELSGVHFEFDLNMDGKLEELPFVGTGSGFLAWDRNSDGVINDGGELFGPTSGHGFTELRQLDADGNGWLDENDPLFNKLHIWMKDQSGGDHLYTLAEKGVGAIFLGSTATPFSLVAGDQTTQGQLRETSIYLGENGRPGTIQHLDYLV